MVYIVLRTSLQLLPGLGNPFLRENMSETHLRSGALSAPGAVSCDGDGSGERGSLVLRIEAGNLQPLDYLYSRIPLH